LADKIGFGVVRINLKAVENRVGLQASRDIKAHVEHIIPQGWLFTTKATETTRDMFIKAPHIQQESHLVNNLGWLNLKDGAEIQHVKAPVPHNLFSMLHNLHNFTEEVLQHFDNLWQRSKAA